MCGLIEPPVVGLSEPLMCGLIEPPVIGLSEPPASRGQGPPKRGMIALERSDDMPARRIEDLNIRELVHRLRQGESDRQVSRDLGLSRNTVKKYREWAAAEKFLQSEELPTIKTLKERREATFPSYESGPRSVVEPYGDFVKEKRAQGVELVALHRLLNERGFTGSYSALRRYVGRFEEKEPEKFVRIESPPGQEAQVDFGYVGLFYDEVSGKKRKAWAFVMTLSYSRHQYAEIVFDQRVETWISLHSRAFEFFGGVPKRIVLDNLKAGIIRAVQFDPEPQRSYREFAEHTGFLISPCRPRTPRHKGKVESGVHYLRRNALAGRGFKNIFEANAYLLEWIEKVAGRRDHGTTHEEPLARFEIEKESLSPLPKERYEISVWKKAKVHPDCHAVFDYAFYSVPHRLVGKEVWLRATATRLEVFHDHDRVTNHPRAFRRGQWVTNLDHYPPEKVQGLLPEPVRLKEEARRIGDHTGELVEQLLAEKPMDRLRSAQGVLRLAKRYGKDRLELACRRALLFDELRYRAVKGILEKGLEAREVDPEILRPANLPQNSRFARTAAELSASN